MAANYAFKSDCALINVGEMERTYTECFVGGGAVFFALQEAFSKSAICAE